MNTLLSFAQFQPERWLWMGGKVPLGYDVQKRKLVVNPAEAVTVPLVPPTADPVLVKARAWAFRCKQMLVERRYATVQELARAEGVKPSYADGMLPPMIVDAILGGRQPDGMTFAELMGGGLSDTGRAERGFCPGALTSICAKSRQT